MWKILEKRPFFQADMAGLGKYHTGGYGRIGVYRVKADEYDLRNTQGVEDKLNMSWLIWEMRSLVENNEGRAF